MVSLLEDWSRDEKPQEVYHIHQRISPRSWYCNHPFVRPSNWYHRINTLAYSKHDSDRTGLTMRVSVSSTKWEWLSLQRLVSSPRFKGLAHRYPVSRHEARWYAPGKRLQLLRLERFLEPGAGIRKTPVTDLRTRWHIVLKHDPMLRAAITKIPIIPLS